MRLVISNTRTEVIFRLPDRLGEGLSYAFLVF